MEAIKTKFRAGKYLIPVTMISKNNRIIMQFAYNKILIEEMKAFDGAKWEPEGRYWHIPDNQRNRFQLEYLQGKNPYARYDEPLMQVTSKRSLYSHQLEMVAFGMTRHYCVFAAEMGCLHGDTLINKHPVKYWYKVKSLPVVDCYDEAGNLVTTVASRIIRKKQKIVRIKIDNIDLRVGSQHLFLALKGGQPCHVRAINLTQEYSLITDKSLGTMITLIQSTPNKKHTGSVSGMAMVRSMNKMVITEVNSRLKRLKQSNNSLEIFNVLKSQIMERLSYLECHGWLCLRSHKGNIHSSKKTSAGISLEDYLMLTDLSQSTVVDELETFMQLYVMLQLVCSQLSQIILRVGLSKGTAHIKYLSMVATEYKNWHTIFTKMQQGILNTKQIDLENPTKFLVAKESDHLIPSSFQLLGALSLKNAVITTEPATWVYDLTVPVYGNYFDDNGINHQNTGKTLAAIEIMEAIGVRGEEAWYIGPKSGVRAVDLELLKWQSGVMPRMMTYEQLTKEMKNWESGRKAPRIVIFDESSKIKTPTAQRSQAAMALADGVRSDWGMEGYVILMSGTPAPKSPVDWFWQTEVAQPGFFKEGNIHKFRSRLAIVEERENMLTGGKYPHLIGWRDSENRCECGLMKDNEVHDLMRGMDGTPVHPFKPGRNEVALLYERMRGLVLVKFKKDCLDLPEKQYRVVVIKPAPDLLQLAKHIKKVQSRAITVLTLLRELSDGFQYKEIETGEYMECPRCHGKCVVNIPVPREEIDTTAPTKEVNEAQFEMKEMQCDNCAGVGQVPTYTRSQDEVPCPKDDQLKEDLDAHEDVGRLIVWGGFTGTIDRIVKICQSEGWSVLRVDGRGYCALDEEGKPLDDRECLMAMDGSHPRRSEFLQKYPKLCFVGHPKAGGMALTLTASPTEIFFSNDFSGEGRLQAEDRFHRPGMDKNRGATIVDYIHLPTDQYVLDNLKKKKDLQKISMGELDEVFKSPETK